MYNIGGKEYHSNQKRVFNRLEGEKKEKKPLRYSEDSFTIIKGVIGKVVKITLSNSTIVKGRL